MPTASLAGPHSRRALRRKVVQTLLAIATHLIRIKPAAASHARVVVLFELPDLAASQVIVFFSAAYFDGFWSRTSTAQTWTSLSGSRSLVREWREPLPEHCEERGYREVVNEGGVTSTAELWAIGELVGARDVQRA